MNKKIPVCESDIFEHPAHCHFSYRDFFCIRLCLRQPDYFCEAAAFFLPAMISIADITTIVPANS